MEELIRTARDLNAMVLAWSKTDRAGAVLLYFKLREATARILELLEETKLRGRTYVREKVVELEGAIEQHFGLGFIKGEETDKHIIYALGKADRIVANIERGEPE